MLFRSLGEGLLSAFISFFGILIGFILAFLSWNFLYLKAIQQAPLIWFPHYFGYKGSIILQVILLIFLSLLLLKFHGGVDHETFTRCGTATANGFFDVAALCANARHEEGHITGTRANIS